MNLLEGVFASLTTSALLQIALIIVVASVLAYFLKLLKQPLIAAYIIVGILLGPVYLGLLRDSELIRALSEIGIAFLLFIVGLEMNIKRLKDIGKVSIIAGLIQVGMVFLIGFYVVKFLGFSLTTAIYIGLILAFSSTLVVIKLLYDQKQINTLNGTIALGVLLLQDIVVIIVLSLISQIGHSFFQVGFALLNVFILIIISFLFAKFILPHIFRYAAESEELLFLIGLATCFVYMFLAIILKLSITIGAFLAGISIAPLPYHRELEGRIKPLRDFFIVMFFVFLGMELIWPIRIHYLQILLLLVFITLVVKPLILTILIMLFGYEKRVSFLASIDLAQISEFSLIIAAQGLILGHISKDIFSLIVLLAIITMVITTYIIKYHSKIYEKFSPMLEILRKLEFKKQKFAYYARKKKKIVLFGCHRMGSIFLDKIKKYSKNFIVVDHNPHIIKMLMKEKIPCLYGDIHNKEVLDALDLENVKLIISTIPDDEGNVFMIEYAKAINPKITIMVTSEHIGRALELYEYGADYVILPHLLGGEYVANLITELIEGRRKVSALKKRHLNHLKRLRIFGL